MNILIPGGRYAQVAEYKKASQLDYQNNPLIEALPLLRSENDVVEALSFYPDFSEEERNLPRHERVHLVQRLYRLFQPLPVHIELESKFSRIIRESYVGRNPIEYGLLPSKGTSEFHLNHQERSSIETSATSVGFAIIGISGIGKTTSINRILNLYPQVIVHSVYSEVKLTTYQVVYLKLDTGHDGSLKGLCIDFFISVDRLIGSSYFEKFGNSRRSVNAMLPAVVTISRQIHLGVLVVDEIQNLRTLGYGAEKVMNFFVKLINTAGVPTVLVGTPACIGLLQQDFKLSRRFSGQGDVMIDRLGSEEWDLIMSALEPYQWTNSSTLFTDEFKAKLFYESQGIVDIGIKLYVAAQIEAIEDDLDVITPQLITKVSLKHFRLIRTMIDALKSGNAKRIAQFDDISFNLNESKVANDLCIGEVVRHKLKHSEDIISLSKHFSEKLIRKTAVQKAEDTFKNRTVTKPAIENKNIEGDIRNLVRNRQEGQSAYHAIKDNGLLRDFKKDLFWEVG